MHHSGSEGPAIRLETEAVIEISLKRMAVSDAYGVMTLYSVPCLSDVSRLKA